MLTPARTIITPQQSVQPTSPINNAPYDFVIDEATTNLVTNPSFEVDTTGWSANGANATISRVTSQKYTGDASLQITVSPAAASQGAVSSSISVSATTKYIFSVWLKGNAGSEAVYIGITGNNSGLTYVTASLTTSWERYRVYKVTNGSDTSVTLNIYTDNAVSWTIFADGAQFEQKTYSSAWKDSVPTTYCDGSLGAGYSWSGTAHASSSSRVAGVHILKPSSSNVLTSLAMKDGKIVSPRIIFAPEDLTNYGINAGVSNNTLVRAPVLIYGDLISGVLSLGNSEGLFGVQNVGNGCAAYFKSATTTEAVVTVDGSAVTSGALLAAYAPSDLSNFTGSFLNFADKSGAASYELKRNAFKIGVANLNQYHYIQGLGPGAYASASTAKSGTISSSGTTVTGSSTAFTTDYVVGDIIVASGQKRVITAIASNTSLTTLTAFNPVISAGTTASRANDQYYPFFLTLGGPKGDHEVMDYVDKVNSLFIDSTDRLKLLRQSETAGTGTLTNSGTTITGVGTAFTTELSVGDIIISNTNRLVVVAIASNTSLTTRTAPTVAISGNTFTYINTTVVALGPDLASRYEPNAPIPTADTSGKYILVEEFKDVASKTTTSNTSEQSIFTTVPTIPAGRLGATGTLEITAFGTLAAAGATKTLTIRVKLGATTILTTHAETLASTGANNWVMNIIIQNTTASAQKTSLVFHPKEATSNIAMDSIIDYETSSVNTAIDQTLDISIQYGTVSSTFTKEAIIAKVW